MLASSVQSRSVVACNATVPRVCTLVLFIITSGSIGLQHTKSLLCDWHSTSVMQGIINANLSDDKGCIYIYIYITYSIFNRDLLQ